MSGEVKTVLEALSFARDQIRSENDLMRTVGLVMLDRIILEFGSGKCVRDKIDFNT